MKIFIPSNEFNCSYQNKGYNFKPLVIEAYLYHLNVGEFEKTQKRLSTKVKTGTITSKKGRA